MKNIIKVFVQMLSFIKQDRIMTALMLAPVLCGSIVRYGVPILEAYVVQKNGGQVLVPYYPMFDLFLAAITPALFCAVPAFIILEEKDDKMIQYYAVTPLGYRGYFIARIGIPGILAAFISILILLCFSLSHMGLAKIIQLSFYTLLVGIITALLIVALAKNKVEGMAYAKLTSLFTLGIPAGYFFQSSWKYLCYPFPTYWLGLSEKTAALFPALVYIVVSLLWVAGLYYMFKKTMRKLI